MTQRTDVATQPEQTPMSARMTFATRLQAQVWWIAGSYALFAAFWIFLSDSIMMSLVSDHETLLRLSVYKGIAFVAVTSVLIFLLIRKAYGTVAKSFTILQEREAQLRGSEHQLSGIISSAMDAMITVDGLGNIAMFNGAAERIFKIPAREAIGRAVIQLMPNALGDEISGSYDAHSDVSAEFAALRGMRANGEEFPVEASVSRTEIDGASYTTLIIRDITERRRSAALVAGQNRILRMVALGTPLATSLDALVRFMESQATDMVCTVLLLDRDGVHVRHGAAPTVPPEYWRAIDGSAIGPSEGSCGTAAFRKTAVFVSDIASDPLWANLKNLALSHGFRACWSTPILDAKGEVLGTFAIYHKETGMPGLQHRQLIDLATQLASVAIARSRTEEDLSETLAGMEAKIAERTSELSHALVRAEAADRVKSAFLATMSHELRTPLNSILGFTGILLQGLAGPLNPEQRKQLMMVQGSARHLLELINDVLDLSRIEAGQLEVRFAPFNLPEAVSRVTESIRPLAEKKGLSLSLTLPSGQVEVSSDRRRTEQILINLLNNAVKFTNSGGVQLVVETAVLSENGSIARPAVRIRVIDTGPGMSPEDLDTLFQPFRQLDSGLTRQHEGTGLGLAICRRLTTLLGGELLVRSKVAHGSEFTIVLPLTPVD